MAKQGEIIETTVRREAVVTAKDLSKTFSNESVQQHVLKNLNLSIYKGDFTVIMGNSGSGKSTLLYALSFLLSALSLLLGHFPFPSEQFRTIPLICIKRISITISVITVTPSALRESISFCTIDLGNLNSGMP